MNFIRNFLFYLYCFSINFELWDPFNLEIDFLVTKITTSLYIVFSILFSKKSLSTSSNKFIRWIYLFLILLTTMSYLNQSDFTTTFFKSPFFLNIIVLTLVLNHQKYHNDKVIRQGFLFFTISTILLTILFFLGVSPETNLEGRETIFGMNQNILGINLVVANIYILIIIFKNIFKLKEERFLLYIPFAMITIFIISTASRVSFISLILSFSFIFLTTKSSMIIKYFSVLIIITFVSLFYFFYLSDTFLFNRLVSSIDSGEVSGRDSIWVIAIVFIFENPIFGFGETGYVNAFRYLPNELTVPHNVIIEILCYTGFVGLFLFFKFLYPIISKCLYTLKSGDNSSTILFIPVLGLLLSGQILNNKIVWLIFGYIIINNYIISNNYTNKNKICS